MGLARPETAEADCGEGHEAEVERVVERPVLEQKVQGQNLQLILSKLN